MMGILPKPTSDSRSSARRAGNSRAGDMRPGRLALALVVTGATAALAIMAGASPLLAQGAVSEFAKTPAPKTPAAPPPPPAASQAQAPAGQTQTPGAPQPQRRPAAPAAAGAAPGKAPAVASPVGSGSGWQANIQPGAQQPAAAAPAPGDKNDAIRKVNAYFNGVKSLRGLFLQTEADNAQKRGKFYLERPGKIRFDYAAPSRLHIISDGEYLAIEDHDLGTTDRYPLESTPFRLLLSKDVDLTRDARILGVTESEVALVLALEDKSQSSAGQIRLFFSKPNIELKEWIISDPQGVNTRISVSEVEVNKELSPELFRFSDVGLRSFNR